VQALRDSDPDSRGHIVRLLRHFEYRSHLCLVFELFSMNLKEVRLRISHTLTLVPRSASHFQRFLHCTPHSSVPSLSLTLSLSLAPSLFLSISPSLVRVVDRSRRCWRDRCADGVSQVLDKFGKGVGIKVSAVRVYAKQLVIALHSLSKQQIIHADIKPHNIVANESFNLLKVRAWRVLLLPVLFPRAVVRMGVTALLSVTMSVASLVLAFSPSLSPCAHVC
jgi:serine/threonine protein kinase